METSDLLNYVAATSIVFGNFWQIFSMIYSKETKALSWGMLVLLSISNISYAISGFILKDFSLWFPDIILVLFVCVQIFIKYYYEKNQQANYKLPIITHDNFMYNHPIKPGSRSFDL